MSNRIELALVEDERDLSDLLKHHFEREGWRVRAYTDGRLALAGIERSVPTAMVLDLMLPGMDGWEICRQVRRRPETARLPILVLTARSEDTDHVAGLELGADDFVTKPVAPRVLVARLRALLRRSAAPSEPVEVVKLGEMTIDAGRHQVLVRGTPLPMTHMEFSILWFLASRPGRVRSRAEIVDAIRGGPHVLERTIDVHVMSIRRKLGAAGRRIETVIGVGYRLQDEKPVR